jgi:hypothetical protein
MSLIADALQPLIVPGILAIRGRMELSSFADAIMSPRAAYDLDFDDLNQRMLFDFRDPGFLTTATAADCCRFSGSAFQTVSSITDVSFDKDSMPWELIKFYYSAFYAGHAIIRLLGESCTFFDGRHISRIDSFGKTIGRTPGFRIDTGLYRCTIASSTTKLTCTKLTGGTHESFWKVFGERLGTATDDVLRGPLVPTDAQAVFGQLAAFALLVKRHGSYRWLSTLRNDIQYRHRYELWYPSGIGQRDRQTLSRLISQWKLDPMIMSPDAAHGDLGEFILTCAFIVALCRVLIIRIMENSPRGRSFLQYGPSIFLN